MKQKTCLLIVLIIGSQALFAQNEEEGVDLLKAPSSPAAQLLNIAPNVIERPTDLSSFWLSVNNATDGLAKFPTNYALDISPASLFHSKIITLKDLKSKKVGDVMWQSFVVSTGIKQVTDTSTDKSFYKAAIGIKLSIVRGSWSAKTDERYNDIQKLQKEISAKIEIDQEEIEAEPEYQKALKKRQSIKDKESDEYKLADENVNDMFRTLTAHKRAERIAARPQLQSELKKKARDFHIERVGPFLDFAGGFSVGFPTNKLNYSIGDYSGAWLTGGYEGGEQKLSILGILRYLYQPETIFADSTGKIPTNKISTFDMGARLLYSTKNDLFTFSFESIYRSVLTKSIVDPSWRLNFSAEYDLGFNKKISLSFGRDFNGMISKGGNLIAALNLIAGFGNTKNLSQ
ncbi:MAG: hypothetical protein U0T79_13565 [Ferruginibacter sp.]